MTSAPCAPASAPADAVSVDRAVLSTVAYGDVFEYPLRDVEVHRYLRGVRATAEVTAAALGGREGLVDTRRALAAFAERLQRFEGKGF